MYEVGLPHTASVAELKTMLESVTSIPQHEQILLWEGRPLEDHRALGSYVSGERDTAHELEAQQGHQSEPVFLFSVAYLNPPPLSDHDTPLSSTPHTSHTSDTPSHTPYTLSGIQNELIRAKERIELLIQKEHPSSSTSTTSSTTSSTPTTSPTTPPTPLLEPEFTTLLENPHIHPNMFPPPPTIPEPLPIPPVNRYNPQGAPRVTTGEDVGAQFAYHLARAEAVVDAGTGIVALIEASAREQYVQLSALRSAYQNMCFHCDQGMPAFGPIRERWERKRRDHERLLAGFDDNVARVGVIKLPPFLASLSPQTSHQGSDGKDMDGERSLLDLVNLPSLQRWKDVWGARHWALTEKLDSVSAKIDAFRAQIEAFPSSPSLTFGQKHAIQGILDRTGLVLDDMQAILAGFASDAAHAGALPAGALSSDAALDAEAKFARHGSHLLMLHDSYDVLAEALKDIHALQVQRAVVASSTLVSMAELQRSLKTVADAYPSYFQEMKDTRAAFQELRKFERLPTTFYAAVVESVRRNRFNDALRTCVARIVHALHPSLVAESRARTRFHNKHGKYLSSSIFPGLSSSSSALSLKLRLASSDPDSDHAILAALSSLDPDLPSISLPQLHSFLGADLSAWLLDIADLETSPATSSSSSSLISSSLHMSTSTPPLASSGVGSGDDLAGDIDPVKVLDRTAQPLLDFLHQGDPKSRPPPKDPKEEDPRKEESMLLERVERVLARLEGGDNDNENGGDRTEGGGAVHDLALALRALRSDVSLDVRDGDGDADGASSCDGCEQLEKEVAKLRARQKQWQREMIGTPPSRPSTPGDEMSSSGGVVDATPLKKMWADMMAILEEMEGVSLQRSEYVNLAAVLKKMKTSYRRVRDRADAAEKAADAAQEVADSRATLSGTLSMGDLAVFVPNPVLSSASNVVWSAVSQTSTPIYVLADDDVRIILQDAVGPQSHLVARILKVNPVVDSETGACVVRAAPPAL